MTLVLDTSVLLAALHRADARHEACRKLVQDSPEPLAVPAPVLVELDYFLRKLSRLDIWVAFAERADAGDYEIVPLDGMLLRRMASLQARYADLRLNLVDASVFITCEALGERKVATLDRRDFNVLRTEDGRALRILPE